ncbi:MAG: transposase [Candidatus Hydrogenedens sp.]|nr:transposase [Candidatus Hydrogenedens sp.]
MDEDLSRTPARSRDVQRRRQIESCLDACHGSCVLREAWAADLVESALLHFDGERYRMMAWVVMPNHVHALFEPLARSKVAEIVESWKKFTSRRINAQLPAGSAALQSGTGPQRLWQREYWDRYIRDERHLHETIEYIHSNPVTAGLVTDAEVWRWSSASLMNSSDRG